MLVCDCELTGNWPISFSAPIQSKKDTGERWKMSANCIHCCVNNRTGMDLLCDQCRAVRLANEEVFAMVAKAVRNADAAFERGGVTGTNAWVIDFFLPELTKAGGMVMPRRFIPEPRETRSAVQRVEDAVLCRCGRPLVRSSPNDRRPWCSGCNMTAATCDCVVTEQYRDAIAAIARAESQQPGQPAEAKA